MILDVNTTGGGSLSHQLMHGWPTYVGYAISFGTIGIMWVNHHTVFEQIDRVDRTFLMINVGFLMVIAFVPFPTRVLAAHLSHDARTAAVFYGLTMVAMAMLYGLLWFYAAHNRRLIAPGADQRTVSGISRAFRPGVPIYGIATSSALLSAWLAVGLYAAIAGFYVVESSLFGHAEAGRSD